MCIASLRCKRKALINVDNVNQRSALINCSNKKVSLTLETQMQVTDLMGLILRRDMNCTRKVALKIGLITSFDGYITIEYWIPEADKNISSELLI